MKNILPSKIKLSRKWKKELKKESFRRVIRMLHLQAPINEPIKLSGIMEISYEGSGNKPYRKLCSYAKREEKRLLEHMAVKYSNNLKF